MSPAPVPPPPPSDSSIRVTLSPQVGYAVLFTVCAALVMGIWDFASQTFTNAATAARVAQMESANNARFDALEKLVATRVSQLEVSLTGRMDSGDKGEADRTARLEAEARNRFDTYEKRYDARNQAVQDLDKRITRLESQASWSAVNSQPPGGRK